MDRYVTKEIMKEHNGRKFRFPLGVLARNVETDNDHQFLTDAEKKELKEKPGKTDPLSNNTVVFGNEPKTPALLKSGSTLGELFPAINAWFRKPILGDGAAKGVTQRTDITEAGYVADARAVKTVNDNFGGVRFQVDGDSVYVIYGNGGNEIMKKIGSSGGTAVEVGTYTGDATIKVTTYQDYRELTRDDFYIVVDGINIRCNSINLNLFSDIMVAKSYDASTGTLTISNAGLNLDYTDDGGDLHEGKINLKYTVFIIR